MMRPTADLIVDKNFDANQRIPRAWGRRMVDSI